jgi:multicomponent Na+:H+ antiporter subunit D
MFAITLNPGFVPLLAALLTLGLPRGLRAPAMASSAFAALWLLLDREFGAVSSMQQMGLQVVPLELDALNQIFGIALLIALVVIAAYASGRRNRFEDAAILVLAGGAVSAVFVGDLILFVAAAALSGMGAAWVVLASPREGSARAGVRLLVWFGFEGLLLLVGVALHLSEGGGGTQIDRLDAASLGGGFIFAAMMIRVGAPFAHVWLKDAVSVASPTGAAALTAFSSMLGVYALARFFSSEPSLMPIGAAMIALGAFYAAAEDDLRSAAAYAQTAQTGVCLALIGSGSSLGLAAVEGHAFTIVISFMALQMGLGALVEKRGGARGADIIGAARAMPFSAAYVLVGGLAACAAPGFALYPTFIAALEAAAQWETRWLWLLFAALAPALFVSLVLRPAFMLHQRLPGPRAIAEAPYGMLLGASLAAFFCIAIGVAPQWLYGLTPTEMSLDPFASDRFARQLQLFGAAGLAYTALRALKLTPAERPVRLFDIDALYRGPLVAIGRGAGAFTLTQLSRAQSLFEAMWATLSTLIAAWLHRLDKPYVQPWAAAAYLAAIGMFLLASLFASRL